MISKRAREIPPFIVMEILEKAQEMERTGESIIHLEIGEPDFETPKCVNEAACRALKEGKTKYTHSLGVAPLRETVAKHYHEKYGVRVSSDQVIITAGTSPAMLLVFGALLDPQDEVVLSDPYYSCYPNFVRFTEGVPVFVPVFEEDGFQYRPKKIREKITPRTKGIIVNSPSNPTGNLLSPEVVAEIARLAPKNCFIVSDEIYHGLVYEGKERTILEFTEQAFVINGFSKLYAMTGWRLGYIIAPPEFIRPLQKLQQNFFISANNFIQWGGIAALKEAGEEVKRMRETYNQRRKYIIPRLKEIGFGITMEPTGAFYVLANAKAFGNDSYKLALDILKDAKVALTPGIDFGAGAEGYLRFSYANSLENIKEAMKRLEKYFG